jgi:hypothetical protein
MVHASLENETHGHASHIWRTVCLRHSTRIGQSYDCGQFSTWHKVGRFVTNRQVAVYNKMRIVTPTTIFAWNVRLSALPLF